MSDRKFDPNIRPNFFEPSATGDFSSDMNALPQSHNHEQGNLLGPHHSGWTQRSKPQTHVRFDDIGPLHELNQKDPE